MADDNHQHPLWSILDHQGRSLAWLARRTEYSEQSVRSIACGRRNATDEFRLRCAKALDLPEHVLFNLEPAEAA